MGNLDGTFADIYIIIAQNCYYFTLTPLTTLDLFQYIHSLLRVRV